MCVNRYKLLQERASLCLTRVKNDDRTCGYAFDNSFGYAFDNSYGYVFHNSEGLETQITKFLVKGFINKAFSFIRLKVQ